MGRVPGPGSYLRFLVLLPCSTSFTASYRVSRDTLLLRGEKRSGLRRGARPRAEGQAAGPAPHHPRFIPAISRHSPAPDQPPGPLIGAG